jgi:cytoskeletal protein RodZ
MATKSEIERLSVVETKVDEVIKRLDKLDEKLESRFAAKWTEWFVKGVVAFVLIWFLAALTHLVDKSPSEIIKENTSSISTPSPSANANASAQSDSTKPTDSQTSTSNSSGGAVNELLKQTGL